MKYLSYPFIHLYLTFTSVESTGDKKCHDPCCFIDGETIQTPPGQTPETRKCWFQNVHQYFPVQIATRSSKPINYLPYSSSDYFKNYVESVKHPTGDTGPFTILELLGITSTDAFLVMHEGKVMYEKYFETTENTRHLVYSCTKSYVALCAAMLAHDEKLDPDELVVNYIPELKDVEAFQNANVRHLMDMSIAIAFDETEYGPDSDNTKYSKTLFANGTHTAIKELKPHPSRNHGDVYNYASPVTDTLGWVIDNVLGGNGKTFEYFEENVWSKLGQEHDLLITMWDEKNFIAGHSGGASATARDMMRFGQMMANMGQSADGVQIVHPSVVEDIMKGGTDENIQQFKNSYEHNKDVPMAYRNMFRVRPDEGIFYQLGIHGQIVWVDTKYDLVVVKHSSNPNANNMMLVENFLLDLLKYGLPDGTGKSSKSKNHKSKKSAKEKKSEKGEEV